MYVVGKWECYDLSNMNNSKMTNFTRSSKYIFPDLLRHYFQQDDIQLHLWIIQAIMTVR